MTETETIRRYKRHDRTRIWPKPLSWAASVCGVLALAGCATNLNNEPQASAAPEQPHVVATAPVQQVATQPIRMTMILPLTGTGPTVEVGQFMKQAGELALFEQNNPLVQLTIKDSKGTAIGASQAAKEAINEGTEIIIGPLTGAATRSVANVTRPARVPVISFSNDALVASDGVYLMGPLPEQEVERIVAYAASQGKRRFAALIPADRYGATVDPIFTSAVKRAGGSVANITRFPPDPNNMFPAVRRGLEKIKMAATSGAPVDAVLLAGSPATIEQVSNLAADARGLDSARTQILGVGNWDFASAGRNPILAGSWYPGTDHYGWQEFYNRFTKSFGTQPPRIAASAYDAVSLAITLAVHPEGQRFTVANLTRASGFQGLTGWLRFEPNGRPVRRLAVMELQQFGTSVREDGNGTSNSIANPASPPAIISTGSFIETGSILRPTVR